MAARVRESALPLNGTLSTMALPDVLQWISTSGKTGRLAVSDGRFRKQIFFSDGVIISSSSDDPRDFLGQFLLANRKITEEQLKKAMESQRATGIMLGKILVMVNAITENDLMDMLKLKAEESLFSLFLWNDGSFEFEDGDVETRSLFPLALKVEDVLLEGLRRYDELQVILKAFPPGDFVLARTDRKLPPKLAQNPHICRLLEVVDGERTLTDICLELHASEFKVSRLAYELYRQKCLTVISRDQGGTDKEDTSSPAELAAKADELMAAHKAEEAIEILTLAVAKRSGDPTLQRKLDEAEQAFVERAYMHYLPPAQVPHLQKPLNELTGENLTPQEVFVVSRLNGSWTVKDIVTISPMREVEALRVLKQLRERGIIDLAGGKS
jgi:hypothetical protein